MTALITSTFAALCLAIDQEDDSALYAMMDYLEEQGDERGPHLRELVYISYRPLKAHLTDLQNASGAWEGKQGWWYWVPWGTSEFDPGLPYYVNEKLLRRLPSSWKSSGQRAYNTRSKAILMLAEAFSKGD